MCVCVCLHACMDGCFSLQQNASFHEVGWQAAHTLYHPKHNPKNLHEKKGLGQEQDRQQANYYVIQTRGVIIAW